MCRTRWLEEAALVGFVNLARGESVAQEVSGEVVAWLEVRGEKGWRCDDDNRLVKMLPGHEGMCEA